MSGKAPDKPTSEQINSPKVLPPPPPPRRITGNQTAENVRECREIADAARLAIQDRNMNEHPLHVIIPGSECVIGKAITGTVLEVCIAGELAVTYQVVWWSGNDRKCEWLNACEVDAISRDRFMPVGFAAACN